MKVLPPFVIQRIPMECGNVLTHAVLVHTRTHTEHLQFTAFCGIHSQIDSPFIVGGDKFIFQCHLRKKEVNNTHSYHAY